MLLTCPYSEGILHPNSSEPWYPRQAQLICSKPEILSRRLVSCLHIRHGSQILMCHLLPWLETARLACNHPASRKPSRSPQCPCPSQQPETYPNKASPRLFAWWTMKNELILLPTREEVLPRRKGKKIRLAKPGKRQRVILERQV